MDTHKRIHRLKQKLRTTLDHFKSEHEWEETRHQLYVRIARDVPYNPLFGDPGPFVNHSFQRLGKLRSIVEEMTRVLDDLNSEVLSLKDLALQVVVESCMAGYKLHMDSLPRTLLADLLRWAAKTTEKDLIILRKVEQLWDWVQTNEPGPKYPPIGGA